MVSVLPPLNQNPMCPFVKNKMNNVFLVSSVAKIELIHAADSNLVILNIAANVLS